MTTMIKVSSVTHAMKGKEILLNRGIRARVERTSRSIDPTGCGYSISVSGNADLAEEILKKSGVKVTGRHVKEGM